MKRYVIIVCAFALLLVSCDKIKTTVGTMFAPKERVSSMTDSERERAIAEKKAELSPINLETQLSEHSIRMTIVPPVIDGDFTESACEKMILKMLQIATMNGISGVNGSSPIAFAASLTAVDRAATGDAPQRMLVKYNVTFYVMNLVTNDIYASCVQEISGVGLSFEDAVHKAINEVHNEDAIQQMINTSEVRMNTWFNNNVSVIRNRVNAAISDKNYAMALAILNSVPEQATVANKYVNETHPKVLQSFRNQIAAEELAAMKNAIAAAQVQYSPEVAAHLAMLPVGSPEAKQGAALYDKYMASLDQERLRLVDLEERRHQEELETLKLAMKYETEAATSAQSTGSASENSGSSTNSGSQLGGKVKSFFAGASVMSIVGQVLSRCIWIL